MKDSLKRMFSKNKYTSEKDFEIATKDDNKSVEIKRYSGTLKEINIPPVIHKLPVKYIGNEAFQEKNLINVIIPDSVVKIGYCAFADNQLTRMIIPKGVTHIGFEAFSNNQLTNVDIPDGVI